MDVNVLTAMSGVLGSLVGSTATVAAAWVTQKTLTRRELVRDEMRKREALYGEFIAECAKLFIDAYTHTLENPERLLPAFALINRIRLCGSHAVLSEAELLMRRVTEQYFSSNLTFEELRQLTTSDHADPLKGFGDACRLELDSMRVRV